MIRWCMVPEKLCATDGQTDGRTEKVTNRGGCPTLKFKYLENDERC